MAAARKDPHTQETQHERDPCNEAVVEAELEAVCPELIVCRSRYQFYVVGVSQADEYYDDKARTWLKSGFFAIGATVFHFYG
jgi:hypothetical protein